MSTEQVQRLYDTLHKIAKGYQTPAQLRRWCHREAPGLSYKEALEMAYENIQEEATRAIKGMRRPKP